MNKTFAVIMVVALFLVTTMVFAEAPETVSFDAKMGTVTMKHADHVQRVGADKCTTCHHASKADGSDAKKCATCHAKEEVEKDGKKVLKSKDAFHKVCKDCHKAGEKGPTKCKECHIKG